MPQKDSVQEFRGWFAGDKGTGEEGGGAGGVWGGGCSSPNACQIRPGTKLCQFSLSFKSEMQMQLLVGYVASMVQYYASPAGLQSICVLCIQLAMILYLGQTGCLHEQTRAAV